MARVPRTPEEMAALENAIIVDHLENGLTNKENAAKNNCSERFISTVLGRQKQKLAADRASGVDNPLKELCEALFRMRVNQAKVLGDEAFLKKMLADPMGAAAVRGLSNDCFNNTLRLMAFNAGLPPEIPNPALPAATGGLGEEVDVQIVDT